MGKQMELGMEFKTPVTDKMKEQLGDWECLYPFFESPDWQKIKLALKPDIGQISPIIDNWFRAFKECKFSDLKIVWLGLCPYHTRDGYTKELVADGLTFSTATKHSVPPSLFKVYKAMESDLWKGMNLDMDRTNKLDFLAHQGILMSNVALTTIEGTAAAHTEIWAPFTSFLIKTLNEQKKGLLFTGFGTVANKALQQVDKSKHEVIELEHPAASAYESRSWRHENIFSRTDEFLKKKNKEPILWDQYLIGLDLPF